MTPSLPVSEPHLAYVSRQRPLQRVSRPVQGFVLTFLATMAALASALEPAPSGKSFVPVRAVFAEGRLWVLSDSGDLASVTESQSEGVRETLPEKAIDLCAQDDHPIIATGGQDGPVWSLRQRSGTAWTVMGTVAADGDELLAMDCAADRITLLTQSRLVDLQGRRQRAVTLSEIVNPGRIYSTYGTAERLFVGINAGEWGGGLRRIDRRSGKVTVVRSNPSGKLCGGPLNTRCDPVNGITAEPGKPGCIVAAIGLIHFSAHGRVLEICGDKVRELYSKPYAPKPSPAAGPGMEVLSLDLAGTIAFFGIIRAGNTLWAAGTDGLYNIRPAGEAIIQPLPELKDAGYFCVGFLPELAVVITTVNQRHSVSGAVPLIVPR